jgi:hypothetical protein
MHSIGRFAITENLSQKYAESRRLGPSDVQMRSCKLKIRVRFVGGFPDFLNIFRVVDAVLIRAQKLYSVIEWKRKK